MGNVGEPSDRPDLRYVACMRCSMRVKVEGDGSSVSLSYDVAAWRRSKCCCVHLDGPTYCCSFLDLERIINGLPLPN